MGQLHTNKLNNVIYLSYSLFNILSTTALDESMKDDDGTWVLTKSKYSILLGILGITKRK